MGGLVARAYLQASAGVHVARLVTLAAPHHGTSAARLGCGRNAHEMRPDSPWLHRCNSHLSPAVPTASIWTRDDELVAPPDSSHLAGARETVLVGLGHMALAFSSTVLARVAEELAQGCCPPAVDDPRGSGAPGAERETGQRCRT
jgi:triacylglycerol lipase